MTLTQQPARSQGIFGGIKVHTPYIWNGLGIVECYVCRECGFIEWYCQDPETIPVGAAFNTELVDVTPDSPYR
jgi:hypothetical protein